MYIISHLCKRTRIFSPLFLVIPRFMCDFHGLLVLITMVKYQQGQ